MKTKKLEKKLALNKKTIAHLSEKDLKKVIAGISGSACGIETCWLECSRFC